MYRIRITLPKHKAVSYRYLDILHDALVNGWIAAGADPFAIIGQQARPWNFGTLGWRRKEDNLVHTLVVGTSDEKLANILTRINPSEIRQVRAATEEFVDFSTAVIQADPAPIAAGQKHLGVLMLSPLVVSVPISLRNGKKWYGNITGFDVTTAVNARLSNLTGRKTNLTIWPDTLYLRIHPQHDVLVRTKKTANAKEAFIIGMKCPLVIEGDAKDLALAWYTGLGEKNRNGFGCIGTVDKGVGRCL
jgi:CRISPR-associated endoribonuclease Cas6